MLLEIIVASSCINYDYGCSHTTGAYYKSNKDLQEFVKQSEQIGQKIVNNNQWIVWTATPIYALSSGQTARFNVYEHVVFGINAKDSKLLFELNY